MTDLATIRAGMLKGFASVGARLYRHRKGGLYVVIEDNARIEATLQPVVVYRSLGDGTVWVRPKVEFDDGRFEAVTLQPDPATARRLDGPPSSRRSRAEIQAEIDEIDQRIRNAPGWGASLAALDEWRKDLRAELRRLDSGQPADGGEPPQASPMAGGFVDNTGAEVRTGDRCVYTVNGRIRSCRFAEILSDGDAAVRFFDGTFDTVKWNRLTKVRDDAP